MGSRMTRKPTHPGRFLRDEFMEPYQITQAGLADALQLNRVTISKLLNEHQKVTPDVALRLSSCLGTSPDVWLNMQTKYDLWEEQQNKAHKDNRQRIKSFHWLQTHAVKVA